MKRIDFLKRFGAIPMYFMNNYEQAVIRSEPNPEDCAFYVKFKGEKEFKAQRGSAVVVDVLIEENRITKDQYDNF